MYAQPAIQQFDTSTEAYSPQALIAPVSSPPTVPSLQDTTRDWKTISGVRSHMTQQLKSVEIPPPVARGPEAESLIDRTAAKYNQDYDARYKQKLAPIALRAEKRMVYGHNHAYKYGYSGIDQTTLDLFGHLNLDLRTMTAKDILKVYQHELLQGEEKQLPLPAAVALLKVKLLDRRAELIDLQGPRRVDWEEIPAPATSPWAQKPVEPPQKKNWLSKAASAAGKTAKKLKFW